MRIQVTGARMHVFIQFTQISCLLCFTTGTHIKMTLINVTGFALGGNLGSEKDIDPPLFTDKVLHKNVHPLSHSWNHLPTAEACFLCCTSGSSAFFSGMNAKSKREKANS